MDQDQFTKVDNAVDAVSRVFVEKGLSSKNKKPYFILNVVFKNGFAYQNFLDNAQVFAVKDAINSIDTKLSTALPDDQALGRL